MIERVFWFLMFSTIDPPPVFGSVAYTQLTSASDTESPTIRRSYRVGRSLPHTTLPAPFPVEPGRSKCERSSHNESPVCRTPPRTFRNLNGGSNSFASRRTIWNNRPTLYG